MYSACGELAQYRSSIFATQNKDNYMQKDDIEEVQRQVVATMVKNFHVKVTPTNSIVSGPAVASFTLTFMLGDTELSVVTLNIKHGGDLKANP